MKRQSELKQNKGVGSSVDYTRQSKLKKEHLNAGSIDGMTEIILSDGKTKVFCKSSKDPVQVKLFWENRLSELLTPGRI